VHRRLFFFSLRGQGRKEGRKEAMAWASIKFPFARRSVTVNPPSRTDPPPLTFSGRGRCKYLPGRMRKRVTIFWGKVGFASFFMRDWRIQGIDFFAFRECASLEEKISRRLSEKWLLLGNSSTEKIQKVFDFSRARGVEFFEKRGQHEILWKCCFRTIAKCNFPSGRSLLGNDRNFFFSCLLSRAKKTFRKKVPKLIL